MLSKGFPFRTTLRTCWSFTSSEFIFPLSGSYFILGPIGCFESTEDRLSYSCEDFNATVSLEECWGSHCRRMPLGINSR